MIVETVSILQDSSVCRLSQCCHITRFHILMVDSFCMIGKMSVTKRILGIKHIICDCIYANSLFIKWVSSPEAFCCSGEKNTHWGVCVSW